MKAAEMAALLMVQEETLMPDYTTFHQSCNVRGRDRVKWEAKLWFLTQVQTAPLPDQRDDI